MKLDENNSVVEVTKNWFAITSFHSIGVRCHSVAWQPEDMVMASNVSTGPAGGDAPSWHAVSILLLSHPGALEPGLLLISHRGH